MEKEMYGIYMQLTGINSLHDDIVNSILDKMWLSVNSVYNLQLSGISVDTDPGGWVCGLVIPETVEKVHVH